MVFVAQKAIIRKLHSGKDGFILDQISTLYSKTHFLEEFYTLRFSGKDLSYYLPFI